MQVITKLDDRVTGDRSVPLIKFEHNRDLTTLTHITNL